MVTTTWTQTAGMTSETNTDNVEDYAEQAEASKNAAAASETAAASSASAAAGSATAAQTAKTAAELAETNAETAETNAANSATTAASQASIATTKASEASASESAAAASASAAAASEAGVDADRVAAQAAASAASTSQTNAATSATNAATSETNAANSATASASSATASANSASAASASETAAATSETNAATSETNAATSETNAATSAAASASSATAAASSASSASTSATSASNAQTAAESARDATLAAYDNFDDRYLGSKASDPTVDNDGNPLVAGSIYFNSVSGAMRVYTGSAWVAAYVNGADYLALSGGTMTGDVAYGDNVKATFGASADLAVYHDGSNSYITDSGTGNLFVQASNVLWLRDASGTAYFSGTSGNEVALYHNGSEKLATTTSGINVTGTVVADGLTVDGTTQLDSGSTDEVLRLEGTGSPYMSWYDSGVRQAYIGSFGNTFDIVGDTPDTQVKISTGGVNRASFNSTGVDVTGTVVADKVRVESIESESLGVSSSLNFNDDTDPFGGVQTNFTTLSSIGGLNIIYDANDNDANGFLIGQNNIDTSVATKHFNINGNGDVRFYEDTGTTAKFFWDASAERLGIGTTSPETSLHIVSSQPSISLGDGTFPNDRFINIDAKIAGDDAHGITVDNADSIVFGHKTNNHDTSMSSEAMRITSSGNVGIGTASPNSAADLHIHSTAGTALWLTSDGNNPSNAGFIRMSEQSDGSGAYFELQHDGSNNMLNLYSSNQGATVQSWARVGGATNFHNASGTVKLTWDATDEELQLSAGVALNVNGWTITESGGSLYFATGGTNKMKLDASGNLDVVGSVNSNATIT